MDKNEIDIGLIVAIAKAQAVKYGALGIQSIEENSNHNGIAITLTDGSIYTVTFSGMMLKSIYDSNNSGVVDNSEMLNNQPSSYYITSSNNTYDNASSGLESINVQDAIDELVQDIYDNIGSLSQLAFDCVLEDSDIIGELDNTLSNFEFQPNTEYIFNLILPIATLSGDLNNTYKISLRDKDNNTIYINCIFNQELGLTSSVGQLCPVQNYDAATGYSWNFKGYYREITEDGTLYRMIYTNDITREYNPSMKGSDLYIAVANTTLKPGTTVMCSEDYNLNGFSFKEGHTYLIEGDWGTGELQLLLNDITIPALERTYKTLSEVGYEEPAGDFYPQDIATYCDTFDYGNIIKAYGSELDSYPKLRAFVIEKLDTSFVSSSIMVEINNFTAGDDSRIEYKVSANGTGNKLYTYTCATSGSYNTEWQQMLPAEGIRILGSQTSLEIPNSNTDNTFIVYGNVDSLSISKTSNIKIIIFGNLGSLILPATTKTILLTATSYSGQALTSLSAVPLADGSRVGSYNVRCIDIS